MKQQIRIRKTKAKDIPAIVAIENQQFPHPWKENQFTSELDHNIAFFYAAEDTVSLQIIGYIIFWVIEDMIELHNIAVSGEHKKKGIGKQLLLFMLEKATEKKVSEIFLEVRQSNSEAISFYEAFKFKKIAVRKQYYDNPCEDAAIFKLNCP
jgi:[ribosomal protein S18]-alanine N-acetyltransferase